MPTRIVTTTYRYKRPPGKRKAPAVVRPAKPGDDNRPEPEPARQPAIVTATGRKRAKLLRAEKQAAEPDDAEATAQAKAFLARMLRPPD